MCWKRRKDEFRFLFELHYESLRKNLTRRSLGGITIVQQYLIEYLVLILEGQ